MAGSFDEVREFVRESLERGESREAISAALASAGWPEAQITRALAAYQSTDYPLPIPRPRAALSAREAFVYLLLYTCLLICSVQFGHLVFNLIDLRWSDALDVYPNADGLKSGIRWAIASLVVAFPVFILLSRSTGKAMRRNPAMRLSWVRKWLTYLTLFVAATVLMGDLINFIGNFLNGDLTTRFVLKSVTVAIITGTIFGYYYTGLSKEDSGDEGDL